MRLWLAAARSLAFLASATLLLGHALAGQTVPQSATLKGVVTDRSTGTPVARAEIILMSDSRSVIADSTGKFTFARLPVGGSQLLVRALGFQARGLMVQLAEGQVLDQQIFLDSTLAGRGLQELPGQNVTAPGQVVSYRLTDFERRRHTGRGQYLTEDDIIKSGAYNVSEAVKHMRGVEYRCEGNGCYVTMFRAPMRCLPEYVVDGRTMNDFGPSTPIRDIVGLEVYMGPSDVPGEFAGTYAGCGVIVIWTRSGPTRRKPDG